MDSWGWLVRLPVGVFTAVCDWFESGNPSSRQHRERRLAARRRLNEELAKPEGERDERLLQQLRLQNGRLHLRFYEVSGKCRGSGMLLQPGEAGAAQCGAGATAWLATC